MRAGIQSEGHGYVYLTVTCFWCQQDRPLVRNCSENSASANEMENHSASPNDPPINTNKSGKRGSVVENSSPTIEKLVPFSFDNKRPLTSEAMFTRVLDLSANNFFFSRTTVVTQKSNLVIPRKVQQTTLELIPPIKHFFEATDGTFSLKFDQLSSWTSVFQKILYTAKETEENCVTGSTLNRFCSFS